MKLSYNSICAREPIEKRKNKSHILPIYATSSFNFENIQEGIEIFEGNRDGHVYSRYANPTVESVEDKLAMLEAYGLDIDPFAILTNSGMSAINTMFSALLKVGDKVLTQGNLYGGTTELLVKVLARFGVTPIFVDLNNETEINAALEKHPEIKMIYLESPTNPTISCISLSLICSIAKQNNLITAIDNTFPTSYLQQPFKFGVDYVIHSTTKFLNGHGNSISGAIIGRDKQNRKTIWNTFKLIGSNCSPFEAWLLNNGLKTLTLRMDRHCQNAMSLANHLIEHPKVAMVNYPGLASHETHEIAKSQMDQFGSMLSFEVKGGVQEGIKFMNGLQMASLAPTLGDIDTLILHPASSSHLNVDKDLRKKNGITDGLIRVSVGIESAEDIINDIDQALDKVV